ncbi:hypothetical protein K492DRAFT_28529 [Lichtheimia hyalospora FSU 10163]|nr:hypothetical protein K492DRAFT_28529 [Lichtheimia hyalospora FSU 10163]
MDDGWEFETVRQRQINSGDAGNSSSSNQTFRPTTTSTTKQQEIQPKAIRAHDKTHPLVRLFENSTDTSSNSSTTPDNTSLSNPLANTPSSIASSPSNAIPIPQNLTTTPSPVIDLDSSAILAPQPVHPISSSPKTTTPHDTYLLDTKDITTHEPPDTNLLTSRKAGTTSAEPWSSSNPLVPGISNRQFQGEKLSPHHRSFKDGQPMMRARSQSDQRQPIPLRNRQGSSPDPKVEESSLKPTPAGLPLARRVRSATTLRPTEEDSVPLKALIANKQHQLYQTSANQHSASSTPDASKANKHHDHRRSISADSTPKANGSSTRRNNIDIPPLMNLASNQQFDWQVAGSTEDTPTERKTLEAPKMDGLRSSSDLQLALNESLFELGQWLHQLDLLIPSNDK